jgi:replication factor C subunit 1
MPSDIRSFFGGRPAGIPAKAPPPKEEKPKGRGRTKKIVIVEDSEDDDDVAPYAEVTSLYRSKEYANTRQT